MIKKMSSFEIATPKAKKYKLFLWGPEGSYKTRTALRLGNVGPDEEPSLAIIDTEAGSEHYSSDFRFMRKITVDPDEVFSLVKGLVRNPGPIKTLIIDSFSVYYQGLVSKYADLFLKREINSKGNKIEYYVIQPRDYQAINREAYNLVRMLIACDLNVIITAHAKDKWGDNMQIIGLTPDTPKKIGHYFDTVIEIEMGATSSFSGIVRAKDRTNKLKIGDRIPWGNDKEAADYISKAFGHTLAQSGPAKPMEIDIQAGPDFGVVHEEGEETAGENDNGSAQQTLSPAASNAMTNEKETLLLNIAKQKKLAGIVDKTTWLNMLKPYGVETANHMEVGHMAELLEQLTKLVPTQGQEV